MSVQSGESLIYKSSLIKHGTKQLSHHSRICKFAQTPLTANTDLRFLNCGQTGVLIVRREWDLEPRRKFEVILIPLDQGRLMRFLF
jgi:hypothetical protein